MGDAAEPLGVGDRDGLVDDPVVAGQFAKAGNIELPDYGQRVGL
jgi:hypothetical protein